MSLHITTFEGASALSDFRMAQLLPRLAAISPHIQGISARFVHLVGTTEPMADAQTQTLSALLTYGEPYAGPTDGPVILGQPVTLNLGPPTGGDCPATAAALNAQVRQVVTNRFTRS